MCKYFLVFMIQFLKTHTLKLKKTKIQLFLKFAISAFIFDYFANFAFSPIIWFVIFDIDIDVSW